MRFYKEYRFQVGRKIEFKDLFSVIDAYLADQGLHYDCLGYDLHITVWVGEKSVLQKLAARFPQLSTPELLTDKYDKHLCLSNMRNKEGTKDEQIIRYIGSKTPRPYNFLYTHFYYRNIDFFGTKSESEQIDCEENPIFMDVSGDYIELHRSAEGPQSTVVQMCIEIKDQQTASRADDYAVSLAERLGKVKYICRAKVSMDEIEKEMYTHLHHRAKELLKTVADDMHDRCEKVMAQTRQEYLLFQESKFSLAKPLKRIGKAHGFACSTYIPGGFFLMSKRVAGGHFLSLDIDNSPRSGGVGAGLVLSGPGFSHDLPLTYGCPENQEEADRYVTDLFEVVAYFESKYMHKILEIYPAAPDWCPECL